MSANIGPVVVGLAVVALLLLFAVLLLTRRLRGVSRRLETLTRGSDDDSLESLLGSQFDRVDRVVKEMDHIATRTALVERDIKGTLGRVGLVRFNPFEDTGGNQSFALAIVDGRGDGFVVSSLHARPGTRIYAKAVTGGTAEGALSDEEAAALRQALAKPVPGAPG